MDGTTKMYQNLNGDTELPRTSILHYQNYNSEGVLYAIICPETENVCTFIMCTGTAQRGSMLAVCARCSVQPATWQRVIS